MGAEEERAPWTGGQCIRAAVPQWPQARPFCSLGLSFFICTMGGQPAGLEELKAQDQNRSHSVTHTLGLPSPVPSATSWPPRRAEIVMAPFPSAGN